MSSKSAQELSSKLKAADPQGHRECIGQLDRLMISTANLRIAIDKQARENQALMTRISVNANPQANLVQLGQTNPDVQRLKLENYRLQKQLEQDYVQPDTYFKLETRPRKFEQDKRKDDQIKMLRKQLEVVRTECLKVGERGTNFLDAQRYERLQRQNQTLRQFVKNRIGKRPGEIPVAIQKIVGVGPEVNNRQSIELPQVTVLTRTNAELQSKVDELNQQEQLLLYQIQLREVSYQQARELNNQLRQQYAAFTSELTNPPSNFDPLSERVQRLDMECARLRTILQQQSVAEGEIGQRMRVAAQSYELNQQFAAMQMQQDLQRRQAEQMRYIPPADVAPMTMVQQAAQQQVFQPPQPPQQITNRLRSLADGSYQPQQSVVVQQNVTMVPQQPLFQGPPLLMQEIEQQRAWQQQQQALRQAEQATLARQRAEQQANLEAIQQQQQQQQIARQQQQSAQLQQAIPSVSIPPPPSPMLPAQPTQIVQQTEVIQPSVVQQQTFVHQPPSTIVQIPSKQTHYHTEIQPGQGPIVINLGDPQLSTQPQPSAQSPPLFNPNTSLVQQRTIFQSETIERRVVSGPVPANQQPIAPQAAPTNASPPPPARNFNINSMFDDN